MTLLIQSELSASSIIAISHAFFSFFCLDVERESLQVGKAWDLAFFFFFVGEQLRFVFYHKLAH